MPTLSITYVRITEYIFKFFIGGWLLCNIVLVSAIHQHESAEPPSVSHSPHPSRLPQSAGQSSLGHTENSYWLSVFYVGMYMLPCSSLSSPHPLPPPLQRWIQCVPEICLWQLSTWYFCCWKRPFNMKIWKEIVLGQWVGKVNILS